LFFTTRNKKKDEEQTRTTKKQHETHTHTQFFDNLDGMHARETNRTSKFGELLDHWCDSFNTALTAASLCTALSTFILLDSAISTKIIKPLLPRIKPPKGQGKKTKKKQTSQSTQIEKPLGMYKRLQTRT